MYKNNITALTGGFKLLVMHNAKEVGDILNINEKTVANRAVKLGLRKNCKEWVFSISDIEKIKSLDYKRKPEIRFSKCGNFLIIPSKLNKL